MPRLLIFRDDNVERQLDLTNRDLRIGRGQENDIVLEDPTKGASRMHAELRYENGNYVVIDLNSQNGTWMEGQRVQRATLQPGVPIIIGPFSLMLEGAPAGASPPSPVSHETLVGRGPAPVETPAPAAAPAARSSGTLIGKPSAVAPAAGAASAPQKPARTKVPPKPGQPVQPGLIAAIARLPKPVIFGGFAGVVIFIMVLGQLFAPPDPNAPQPKASTTSEATQEGPPPGRTNADIIAEHLTAGTEMLERDPEGAIRDHIDRILLIDRNHPQALDLKAKAEDRIQQLKLAAATPASTIPAPASTIPGPAPSAAGASTPAPTVSPVSNAPPQPAAAAASTTPAAPARSTATTIPPAASTPPAGRAAGARGSAATDPTLVARRPKETEAAWRARSKAVQTQYQNARAALDRGDFASAISGFDAILREQPAYQDSETLLARAREGQQAAGRQAAQQSARQAFEAAIAADVAGNWAGAIQQFERARQLDSSLAPQAEDGMRRAREKMRVAGSEAFKRARQYDALGRTTDAIAQYTEAATLLPPEDPNSKVAKDRLDALRAGK